MPISPEQRRYTRRLTVVRVEESLLRGRWFPQRPYRNLSALLHRLA
ncbi:hypothetical protein [Xanthomonas sp. GPE 39]|nr:hypothetical protein [Xanthomonas sp. GPE 39]